MTLWNLSQDPESCNELINLFHGTHKQKSPTILTEIRVALMALVHSVTLFAPLSEGSMLSVGQELLQATVAESSAIYTATTVALCLLEVSGQKNAQQYCLMPDTAGVHSWVCLQVKRSMYAPTKCLLPWINSASSPSSTNCTSHVLAFVSPAPPDSLVVQDMGPLKL
ncbi:hypothetical protein BC830DRAFT_930764 [Chytriomyces sp. MP71]|nr:hypothetical protein BC830DRAFT_930764 [Chytriomyces sp. MP71]